MPAGNSVAVSSKSRPTSTRLHTASPRATKVERVQNAWGSSGIGVGPWRALYARAASGTLIGQSRVPVTTAARTQRKKLKKSAPGSLADCCASKASREAQRLEGHGSKLRLPIQTTERGRGEEGQFREREWLAF